jgi:ABC-type nitrate/sulfonate/bicarbonate transport system substrate-binding protein
LISDRTRRWVLVTAVGAAAVIGAVLLARSWSTREPAGLKLRVAYIENASCWPFFVAMENGLFEKTGLHVEAVKAQDSTEAMNALVAGQAEVSVENTYSVIFAVQARSPGLLRLLVPKQAYCPERKVGQGA